MSIQTQSLHHDCRSNPLALSLSAIGPTWRPHCSPARNNPARDLTGQIDGISQFALYTGGFSDIYSGTWDENIRPRVRRKVALKLLRVFTSKGVIDTDTDRVNKRLNREVDVWRRLDHPNIAQFLGISYQFGGRPSIVMQWYGQGTASHYLRTHPDIDKLPLIHDIALGLKYLHTLPAPIVHGDVKGNNVLITDDGRAVLTDFGVSKIIEDRIRPTGNTTGSSPGAVRWQAPEFFIDPDSDFIHYTLASDVWSFACTTYELLSGNLPWRSYNKDWVIIRLLQDGNLPAEEHELHVLEHSHDGIQTLLRHCWMFSPACRPLMIDIETYIERLPEQPSTFSL